MRNVDQEWCIAHALQGLTELDPTGNSNVHGRCKRIRPHFTPNNVAGTSQCEEGAQQCHLCRCSAEHLPTICGRFPWAECTQSPKVKASRETQRCRCCRSLREGEVLFAILDDVYTVSMPDRVCDIHRLLAGSLCRVRHPGCMKERPSSGMPQGRVLQVT